MLTNLKNACVAGFRSFHNEEDGVEAIQAVIILAVAGVAMIVVKGKWKDIKEFFDSNVKEGISSWDGAAGG